MRVAPAPTSRGLLHSGPFRRFWLGFTVSAVGDAMTRVALVWYVLQTTHSPRAVGWLLLCYTGPVVVGGLVAGVLLDRFGRRRVMLLDTIIRGAAVATIPALHALGHLSLWYLYVVAAVYGFLYMITLAGTPSLIPALVSTAQLSRANAFETLSYTVSGVAGPPLAGLLIARVGAPTVVLVDAFSYAAFALALLGIGPHREAATDGDTGAPRTYGLQAAVRLLLTHPVLLATTLMFMVFNVGEGFLAVWLPVFAARVPSGGPQLYGLLLGGLALGETGGALLAGGLALPGALGLRICLAQILAGLSLALLWVGQSVWWAFPSLILLGVFSAPLTIWAQTLRMGIIPEPLRGRTFALLRTLMQGSGPLASAAGGVLLPLLGLLSLVGSSALLVGAPGVFGLQVKDLRQASAGVEAAYVE